MRITRRKIEQAIYDKYGIRVQMIRGKGYYYFIPAEGDTDAQFLWSHSTAVWQYCLNGNNCPWIDVEWWVRQFEDLIQ